MLDVSKTRSRCGLFVDKIIPTVSFVRAGEITTQTQEVVGSTLPR